MFRSPTDYCYFLELYEKIMTPGITTYAYCLLPNHFHFLIKVNNDRTYWKHHYPKDLFCRLFQTYAQSYNKKYFRYGSLFQKPYRRIEISSDEYFKQLIFYIHYNPQKHEITNNFRHYEFSSYRLLLSGNNIILNDPEGLGWFNHDASEYLNFHNYKHDEKEMWQWIIDCEE